MGATAHDGGNGDGSGHFAATGRFLAQGDDDANDNSPAYVSCLRHFSLHAKNLDLRLAHGCKVSINPFSKQQQKKAWLFLRGMMPISHALGDGRYVQWSGWHYLAPYKDWK